MLREFLSTQRDALVAACVIKSLRRPARPLAPGLQHGVPQFLDQLIETLRLEGMRDCEASVELSGPSGGVDSRQSGVGKLAALHSREMLASGYTVEEVVHEYGDVCQAITELAEAQAVAITVDEFHTLNRCLDNAIADAVSEYAYGKQAQVLDETAALRQEQAFFIHEVRNHLNTAILANAAVRTGKVAPGGATGDILQRSLSALAALIDKSISEVRGKPGGPRTEVVPLWEFIGDSFRAGVLTAEALGCTLVMDEVDPTLAIQVDRDIVFGALANLLTNAFKFSDHGSEIAMAAFAAGDRVQITVADHCGGLTPEAEAALFRPYAQSSTDRTGLGLGLAISRKSVEACGGTLTFRNIPGHGCVFTIALPRLLSPEIMPAVPAPVR